MKLTNSIILALAVASFVIGVHQTFTVGFELSYWIFMITVSLIILNRVIKPSKEDKKEKKKPKKKKKGDQPTGNRQMRRAMKN
jgi:membrane protein implicated in regulation of membrane protease activity